MWTVAVLAVLSTIGGFLAVRPALDADHDVARARCAAARRGHELGRNGSPRASDLDRPARDHAGIFGAYLLYEKHRIRSRARCPLLEHKFYWDEVYDLVFYRPAVFVARRSPPLLRAACRLRLDRRDHARLPLRRRRGQPGPRRTRARARARARRRRRRPRRRLPRDTMTSWLTTILILLPMAGALVIWLVPMPRHWVGSPPRSSRSSRSASGCRA